MTDSIYSSANSSDPEVDYEPLSLKWVQQTYGLPMPPDKPSESLPVSNELKDDNDTYAETKNHSHDYKSERISEQTENCHSKHLEKLRREFEYVRNLSQGNLKIKNLEILIKKWLLDLERITDSQNLQTELLEENIRGLYELYLQNLENERQVVKQYKKTVILLNKRLDRKTKIIAKLREDKMMLQQWISSTYRAVAIFIKDVDSPYSLELDHVIKVSRKPDIPKIRNIQTHLLYLLRKYLSFTEKVDEV